MADLIRTPVFKALTQPQMFAGAAIALLNKHNISALVVAEGDMPVGVVHFHDLLRIGAA